MWMAIPNYWVQEPRKKGVEPGSETAQPEPNKRPETPNSKLQTPKKLQVPISRRISWIAKTWASFSIIVFCGGIRGFAAQEGSHAECEARARREYWRANAAHAKDGKDIKVSWEFARACFDVGEFATNSTERA